MAEFVYLLLPNEKIRDVINTITTTAVLILGRFSSERTAILDAVREELHHRDYVPSLFDFDKPTSKDVTGTVETLAAWPDSSGSLSKIADPLGCAGR